MAATAEVKDIGAHTRNVTDVVTDIVSNNCRVPRIVFRDSDFNFTDKVSSNISSLGVDTAAGFCQQSQRRAAEGISKNELGIAADQIDQAHTDGSDTDDCKAHNGTGFERHIEGSVQIFAGSNR